MAINSKGLEQDVAPMNQSKDTTRFVLNGVNESLDGDLMNLSNENSNLLYTHIKEDFVVLGSLYIGDGETIIFSVKNDNSESEIGILKDNTSFEQTGRQDNYELWCNDSCQTDDKKKLNFRVDKPIDSTYRIRRGCEKNIYFTDDWNEPRKINLQKPELYQDIKRDKDGNITSKCWNSKKFKLINTYEKIPEIKKVEVIDGSGNLKSGSYSYMIQYLDEDFNPSPTVLEINNVHIYKDSLKDNYPEINGSTSLETDAGLYDTSPTGKAVRLKFDNLDEKYSFYRVICIEYTTGSGRFTKAFASHPLSTEIKTFLHSTNDYAGMTEITVEELIFSDNNTVIERAEHIEQIDNTLLLGNIQGQQANICDLQKYASQVTVDCWVKPYTLTSVNDPNNAKNPLLAFNGLSFQPGEIYSLGIMYIFEDLTVSPVYHIPGKGPGKDLANRIYASEDDGSIYAMKNEPDEKSFGINANANITYTDRSFCSDNKYWGKDFEGKNLDKDTKVRHHRFPTRNEIGVSFVNESVSADTKKKEEKHKESTDKIFNVVTLINENKLDRNIKEKEPPFSRKTLVVVYDLELENGRKINKTIPLGYETENELYNVENKKLKKAKVTLYEVDEEQEKKEIKVIYDSNNVDEINKEHSGNDKGLEAENFHHSFITKIYRKIDKDGDNAEDTKYTETVTVYDEQPEEVENKTVLIEEIKLSMFISNEKISFTRGKSYESMLFGIKLSNVKIPSEEEIGKKIIGYYVMKQERTEFEKTILATGILTPTVPNNNYRNIDWFAPFYEYSDGSQEDKMKLLDETHDGVSIRFHKISKDCYGLTTLEHIFQQKTYDNFDVIEEQGVYEVTDQQFSGNIITDSTGQKTDGDFSGHTKDDDKMTVRQLTQCTTVKYKDSDANNKPFILENENVNVYDLQPLTFGSHPSKSELVYNMSFTDRKMAIMYNLPKNEQQRKDLIDNKGLAFYRPDKKQLPYVYLKKNKQEFYVNYRQNPYYKINENYIPINQTEVKLMGGDITISPMRLSSHSYQGVIAGYRQAKQSWWQVVVGVLAVIAAVVVTVFSWGALSSLGAAIAVSGIGLMAAGTVLLGVAEQVRADQINDMLTNHWKNKLDNTVYDTAHHVYFRNPVYFAWKERYNFNKGREKWDMGLSRPYRLWWDSWTEYTDDTMFLRGKVLCDVFFESQINASLMCETSQEKYNPLKPLKPTMKPASNFWTKWSAEIKHDTPYLNYRRDFVALRDDEYKDNNEFNNYFHNKTFEIDDRGKPKLVNISVPTIYHINSDYSIPHKIKSYFHLPIEYDCCSKCKEDFIHRCFWSNQSFSEELTDNYRIFKPNNYKDLHGETGELTNMFVFQNNLYLQTEEALWLQPRNQQQQVIDQVVTFLGTGEYYSLPPQKIIDSKSGYSGGTLLKQSIHVTPYGILYVSEKDRKIYLFNGKLESISDKGLQKWFNKNILFEVNKNFKNLTRKPYPYMDNPQLKVGAGFVSVFDKENERYIFTKKDLSFSDVDLTDNEELCISPTGKVVKLNVQKVLKELNDNLKDDEKPWKFVRKEDCGMLFEQVSTVNVEKEVSVQKQIKVAKKAKIWVYPDYSGSFNSSERNAIKKAADEWEAMFREENPSWEGNLEHYNKGIDGGIADEQWLLFLERIMKEYPEGTDFSKEDIVVISFVNEASPGYDNYDSEKIPEPTKKFKEDRARFLETVKKLKSFQQILYPICNQGRYNKALLQTDMAAIKGRSWTQKEIDEIIPNKALTDAEWKELTDTLKKKNPYGINLEEHGIKGWYSNDGKGSPILTAQKFKEDLDKLLSKTETIIEKEVIEVPEEVKNYKYVPGETMHDVKWFDYSWTISYSLKNRTWTSWHSYMPNHYIDMEKYFYSWLNGNSGIFKHNIPHKFQEFYGKKYPFIIEFVNNENPIQTKIFEYISFITQALEWNEDLESYVEKRFITFNKGMFYNSRQNSGILNLVVKDTNGVNEDYLWEQVKDYDGDTILLDRNEIDWTANEMRDYRIDYNIPLFIENKKTKEIQDNYFIDKVVNEESLDYNKPWETLEMLRDKYLVVRLIFDNFEDIKLVFNFSRETELPSPR